MKQTVARRNWRASKVQSFAKDNPRALLFQIMTDNPQASRDEVFDLCLAAVEDNPAFIEPIVEYWFVNNYRIFYSNGNSNSHDRSRQPSRMMIDSIKAQISLLNIVLPTGKTLGESTGTECVKLGGWLSRIGQEAGKQIIAEVFSEQQLRDLLAEHA
jgi:hypothetical protein